MNYRKQGGNFQFEDVFSKSVQDISKNYLEVASRKIFEPQFEIMNNNYYDLFYTVIKNIMKKEL